MNIKDFVDRLPADSVHRTTIEMAGGAVQRFRQQAADVRQNRKLSSEGHASEIRSLGEKLTPFFNELKAQQAKDRKALENRKAEFTLKPQRSDSIKDLIAEIRADRLITALEKLPLADKIRRALDNSETARAILNNSPMVTGIDGDIRDRILQSELEREFGAEQLESIKQESHALDVVDSALAVAEHQLLVEAGVITGKQSTDKK